MRQLRVPCLLLLVSLCSLLLGQAPAPPADIEVIHRLPCVTREAVRLALDVYRPQQFAGALPVVLLLHGGSWIGGDRGEMRPLAEVLAGRGYAVVVSDYRPAPAAIYPAQVEDARAAAQWLRAHADEYRFDLARFTVAGISAGGHLAAMLALQPDAATPRPTRVITLSAPMDLTGEPPNLKAKMVVRFYLGADRDDDPALYARASPVTAVTPAAPPFLLLHGTDDPYVPFAQAARMAEALRQAHVPVVLHPLPDLGHSLPAPSTPLGRALTEAMLAFLAGPEK